MYAHVYLVKSHFSCKKIKKEAFLLYFDTCFMKIKYHEHINFVHVNHVHGKLYMQTCTCKRVHVNRLRVNRVKINVDIHANQVHVNLYCKCVIVIYM